MVGRGVPGPRPGNNDGGGPVQDANPNPPQPMDTFWPTPDGLAAWQAAGGYGVPDLLRVVRACVRDGQFVTPDNRPGNRLILARKCLITIRRGGAATWKVIGVQRVAGRPGQATTRAI